MKISDPWSRFTYLKRIWAGLIGKCNTPQEAINKLSTYHPYKQSTTYTELSAAQQIQKIIMFDRCSICNKDAERIVEINEYYSLCGNCLIKALQLFEDEI